MCLLICYSSVYQYIFNNCFDPKDDEDSYDSKDVSWLFAFNYLDDKPVFPLPFLFSGNT